MFHFINSFIKPATYLFKTGMRLSYFPEDGSHLMQSILQENGHSKLLSGLLIVV